MGVCLDILGPLELVTAPTLFPVTPSEAKTHCRVEIDADDTYITDILIPAATEFCEAHIDGHRQIMSATYDLPIAEFWEGPLPLPRPPLQSVTSLKYYDTDGTLTTLASTYYLTRIPFRQPGSIERAPDQTWPSLQSDRRLPIVVRFVGGWSTAALVPKRIKQAVLMLVGHWYVNREAVGQAGEEMAMAVDSLLKLEQWGSYA
jgi:uncharacterized phiE125 gp8 family phage protein